MEKSHTDQVHQHTPRAARRLAGISARALLARDAPDVPGIDAAGGLDSRLRSRLRNAVLKDLSLSERLLIVLCYVERMTLGEIAAVLDLSRDQVSAMHQRIVERLGQSLRTA